MILLHGVLDLLAPAANARQGGYILREAPGLAAGAAPDAILMGTGSEVSLCLAAQETLATKGIRARVVSLPCWMLFDAQPESYREQVLPRAVRARVAAEAGAELGWGRYLGLDGEAVCMRSFGASAPAEHNYKHFGITAEAVVQAAERAVKRCGGK